MLGRVVDVELETNNCKGLSSDTVYLSLLNGTTSVLLYSYERMCLKSLSDGVSRMRDKREESFRGGCVLVRVMCDVRRDLCP